MQQWTCGSPQQDNQIWNLNYVGGSGGTSWLIQNKYSGMCLDVYQAKYQNGTPIVQWPCDGSDLAQQFVPISSGNPCTGGTFYDFKAYAASAYTIEVYGQSNTNGAKVDLWSDWGGLYQTWYNCASPSLPVG